MSFNSRALLRPVSLFALFIVFLSLIDGNPTCDVPIPWPLCTDEGITQSSFPNDFGHLTVEAVAAALTSNFSTDNLQDSCSRDLGLYACLLFFPDCRTNQATQVNVVRRPCRDFCERVQAACASIDVVRIIPCDLFSYWDPSNPTACYDPLHLFVINEIQMAPPFNSVDRFVELWDYGMGGTLLKKYIFISGTGDGGASGDAVEELSRANLEGARMNENGYLLITTSGSSFASDIEVSDFADGRGVASVYRGTPNE